MSVASAPTHPNFEHVILDCDVKLFRMTGPKKWTPTVGVCRLRLKKVVSELDAACQVLAWNNLKILVLNALILEGVSLSKHSTHNHAFTLKLWPRTAVCAKRSMYCIKFVGKHAQVNSNMFSFIWSVYSRTAHSNYGESIDKAPTSNDCDNNFGVAIFDSGAHDESMADATIIIKKETTKARANAPVGKENTPQLSAPLSKKTKAVGTKGKKPPSKASSKSRSTKDEDVWPESSDDDAGSINLLSSTSSDEESTSKKYYNTRSKKVYHNEEWDGQAINESQPF